MSESILEQIAAWHAAALATVTVTNGYQQTLTVTRPEDLFADGAGITDLATICELGECSLDAEPDLDHDGKLQWRQVLHAWVHLAGPGATGLTVDKRITRVIADIHKMIGVELAAAQHGPRPYCSSLAYRIELLPWQIGILEGLGVTVVDVPIAVAFEVSGTNPYSQ
jgi:hypothetical protein